MAPRSCPPTSRDPNDRHRPGQRHTSLSNIAANPARDRCEQAIPRDRHSDRACRNRAPILILGYRGATKGGARTRDVTAPLASHLCSRLAEFPPSSARAFHLRSCLLPCSPLTSVKGEKSDAALRTYAFAPAESSTGDSTALFFGRGCDGDRRLTGHFLSHAPNPARARRLTSAD